MAADTAAMQRSKKPSRGPDRRFASSADAGFSTGSPAAPVGVAAIEDFDSSCLLIVFYAANRFVSDKLRRRRKREAMSLPQPITSFRTHRLPMR
jgi:hypothetical protein